MHPTDASLSRPGLRERKKQQTRETIERVALQLFAERGYDQTTLAEIAEAADVSPRTIFAYFQSKEDILFCEQPTFEQLLRQKLEARAPGTTTVDALREFLFALGPPDDHMKLRKEIIRSNEALRLSERARAGAMEQVLAESIARDLGTGQDDVRPTLIAASMTAAFTTVSDRLSAESGEPISYEQALPIIEEVLEFLRGGLEALRER